MVNPLYDPSHQRGECKHVIVMRTDFETYLNKRRLIKIKTIPRAKEVNFKTLTKIWSSDHYQSEIKTTKAPKQNKTKIWNQSRASILCSLQEHLWGVLGCIFLFDSVYHLQFYHMLTRASTHTLSERAKRFTLGEESFNMANWIHFTKNIWQWHTAPQTIIKICNICLYFLIF